MSEDDPHDKIGTVPIAPFWPVGAIVLGSAVSMFLGFLGFFWWAT